MDPSLYKDITTSRGLTYHYYFSPAKPGQPTLLLQHGFPSTSHDWYRLVSHLLPHGYGLIVPDLLGYGGTSKPEDLESYEHSLMSRDIVDILDAEGVDRVISVGHDWGSIAASRLYNYFPERVSAGVFFTVPYAEPSEGFDLDAINAQTKQFIGYEMLGYWYVFTEENSDKLIADHWNSFISIIFPGDPGIWATDLAPVGKLKEWLLANRTCPRPSYLTEDELNKISANLAQDPGVKGGLNWYRSWRSGINTARAKPVAEENRHAKVPVFYANAKYDCLSPGDIGKQTTARLCPHPDTVSHDYDGDHWIMFSHAEVIAADLVEWIEGLRKKGSL